MQRLLNTRKRRSQIWEYVTVREGEPGEWEGIPYHDLLVNHSESSI